MSVAKESRAPFWGAKVPREFKFLNQLFINKVENAKFERTIFRQFLKGTK